MVGQSGSSYSPTSNITLYAQWTAVRPNLPVTISFNTSGGNSVSPVTVNVNSTILLVTPTRLGYTFRGWFTSASGGTLVSRNYRVIRAVTLYAHWAIASNTKSLSTVIYPFAINKTNLTPTMVRDLAAFAAKIVRYHLTRISVVGLADVTGNRAANLVLGLGRAQAVETQLLADIRMLAPSMKVTITAISLGDRVQPASNSTAAGRAYNRQVSITAKP